MITEFKIKNKRYACDVDECNNYAYAEMHRLKGKKQGWMYVCKKHYRMKFSNQRKPKEKGIAFCLLSKKEMFVNNPQEKQLHDFFMSEKETISLDKVLAKVQK